MTPAHLYILLALVFVLLNAFFVAAEFAIVKIRATRVEEMARKGWPGAWAIQKAVKNLDAYLSATQLGITLASLALGWVGEPAFARLVEPLLNAAGIWSEAVVHGISLSVAFATITILHIVLGELAPKSLAIRRAEGVAVTVAFPLWIFYLGFYPALWFLNALSNFILRIAGIEPASLEERAHSDEELRMILLESRRHGALSVNEASLLENVLDYRRRTAGQIMVPRADIVFLALHRSWEENLAVMHRTGHTRYPLCEEDIDHVIGMVHLKDLLLRQHEVKGSLDLMKIKRDIFFAPESQALELLQRDFQQKHLHMAIVVDEYGSTAGLVTFEDVLEELVGEIQDEFDAEPPQMEKTPEGYLVDGLVLVDDVAQRLGISLGLTDANTIGGYVSAHLGRLARVGDSVTVNGYLIKVIEMRGRRVTKLLVSLCKDTPSQG